MTHPGDHTPPQISPTSSTRSDRGSDRRYVRFAVMGTRTALEVPRSAAHWPRLLAKLLAEEHDVSSCDASTPRATAYDVRRAQLRVAVAHRPHLVAIQLSPRQPPWPSRGETDEVSAHLTHCAQVLGRRGAVLVTARPSRRPRHGSRAEQLNAIYDHLATSVEMIRLDGADGWPGMREQFVAAARARGLELVGAAGTAR